MSREYRRMSPINVGDRFNRLLITGKSIREGEPRWDCLCDCGKTKTVLERSLKNGHTQSCGCIHRERAVRLGQGKRTHGHSPTPNGKQKLTAEYTAWRAMRRRCYKVTDKSYKDYGAKGIVVCSRWLEAFENFFADIGPKPSPLHSIERRNGKGNYEPSNCYWATRTEQNRNKSNNLYVTIDGVTRCLAEWSQLSGIRAATLQQRVHAGWPTSLLFIPPKLGRRINAVR